MKRTIWGQALDAVSQSRDAAAIVGINAQRFNSIAFGIGAALAAAAGALVAPIFSLAPDMGVLPNIHAYVIVILGRSEEHTSELQSPCNLVCRLLLEKKKTQ